MIGAFETLARAHRSSDVLDSDHVEDTKDCGSCPSDGTAWETSKSLSRTQNLVSAYRVNTYVFIMKRNFRLKPWTARNLISAGYSISKHAFRINLLLNLLQPMNA